VKLDHGIEFLCEEMKVKVSLRFRGREMMHKEFGFQVVEKFINDVAPYGHPDAPPKLIGKGITVMVSPLPRNKRAKNPRVEGGEEAAAAAKPEKQENFVPRPTAPARETVEIRRPVAASHSGQINDAGFNNPFSKLDVNVGQ
jgi:hypothetical protein